jgi:hypothetical protein
VTIHLAGPAIYTFFELLQLSVEPSHDDAARFWFATIGIMCSQRSGRILRKTSIEHG